MLNARVIGNLIQPLFYFYILSNIRKTELSDNFMGVKKRKINLKWFNTAY